MNAKVSTLDLLIVDDDLEIGMLLVRHFTQLGFAVDFARAGVLALQMADRKTYQVAIIDVKMPGMSGLRLLEEFQTYHPECEVILISGFEVQDAVVLARQQWNCDFLTKPFPMAHLERAVQKAHAQHQLRKENSQLRSLVQQNAGEQLIIGQSPAMVEVQRQVALIAEGDEPVLIYGERGTGKKLVARSLHRAGQRADQPFVSALGYADPLSRAMLESEFFGQDASPASSIGSIDTAAEPTSGARLNVGAGLIELAASGTLLIEEAGETTLEVQTKLLRLLADGCFERIGSQKVRRANLRAIFTSVRDLSEAARQGSFREELLHRISCQTIQLPALRNRIEDVRLLARHFLGEQWSIEEKAIEALEGYHWPGNVHQLRSALERARHRSANRRILFADLPDEITANSTRGIASPTESSLIKGDLLSTIERVKVMQVLEREKGNKTKAARALGIDRRKLYRLLDKYDLRDFGK